MLQACTLRTMRNGHRSTDRLRASEDRDIDKESKLWYSAKLTALFLLSFGLALHFVAAGSEAQHSTPARRLLREIDALPSNGSATRCRRSFGSCEGHHAAAGQGSALGGFDWEAYLLYYPALRKQGITTEAAAADHFARIGRAEGRVGRRLRVLLRYTAGTGLINQHYSHIAAFSLAAVLGAELVLPPSMHRSSFEHVFSVFKGQSSVKWSFAPLETLYDVDTIVETWHDIGIPVHRTPRILRTPDLSQPQTAFPAYDPAGGPPEFLAARLHNVFGQNLDMSVLVSRARAAILDTAQAALRMDPEADVGTLALDLPCTFFMLNAARALAVVQPVARAFAWAPSVQALADRVVAGLTSRLGSGAFNGVHLRIEKDAEAWARILGGRHVVEARYRAAMRTAAFDARTPLYVASALLTYQGGAQELQAVVANLTGEGLTSGAVYKEMFLAPEDTATLHSEQKGLIDFLVLAKAARFVGFGPSTYSFFLREYRTLAGVDRAASVLVDGSRIGTDPLFHAAGILNPPLAGEYPHPSKRRKTQPRIAEGVPGSAADGLSDA